MAQTINFLIYQIGWFACVLGGAYHRPWLGTSIAALLVCVHMILTTERPNQIRLMFAALCVGMFVDTLLLILGVYSFPSGSVVNWLPPLWMTVLWIQFATTFRYCLAWMSRRYILCALSAFVGAPLAFWGGERMGAVLLLSPRTWNMLILASVWTIALPLLLYISDRIHANASAASYLGLSSFKARPVE